ncbi:STAS domain-containing protein [bacterium]|nr:STAS domain-containing protein [bacterium]
MGFKKELNQGVAVIRVNIDRLDTHVTPELKTIILQTFEQNEVRVAVDLSGVAYVDSSGLGALLFGLRLADENDGDFRLIGANSRVQKLIEIAHLTENLFNHETEEDAVTEMNIRFGDA